MLEWNMFYFFLQSFLSISWHLSSLLPFVISLSFFLCVKVIMQKPSCWLGYLIGQGFWLSGLISRCVLLSGWSALCVSKCCGCRSVSGTAPSYLNPLQILLLSHGGACPHSHGHAHIHVVEYLVQRRDLGVAVSVMDMAVISAVLAFAEFCCLPLGSVRPVLLSSHILLACCCCS